ncbi:MAG: hypothetical protein IJU81_08345 [Bacteroidales bacterium]|nr:hypothetical protein [Bacteroidales bacterium]
MKKIIIATLAIIGIATAAVAQENTEVRVPSGYQGFLDQTSLYRVFDDMSTTVGFSTTHGFYFNGHTFIGIGFALEGGDGFFAMPLYTSVKYNFSYTKTVSPTIQARVGSYISDNSGAYADLSFGLRFASKRDFAVNLMLAGSFYEGLKLTYHDNEGVVAVDEGRTTANRDNKANPISVGLRVGIEW